MEKNQSNSQTIVASEKQNIEEVIKDSICWALSKDIERLFKVMAGDENLIIVNPDDSKISGITEFRKHSELWMDPRFEATEFNMRELSLNLSESKTVAWFSCRMDDLALWEGKQCGWENIRWTGVLEKRENRWQVVQMHFSFPKE